jgi:BRCA1-associated protein
VHLYREGDEPGAMGGDQETHYGSGEGNSKGQDSAGGDEEGTILCIPAVPSYMSPSDFLGFIGEKWRGYVSHYRMIMTGRVNRYMVLMKFRDSWKAQEWRKEFDGKPFDSVEVSCYLPAFLTSRSRFTDCEIDRDLPCHFHQVDHSRDTERGQQSKETFRGEQRPLFTYLPAS